MVRCDCTHAIYVTLFDQLLLCHVTLLDVPMRLASPWSPRLSEEPGQVHERLVAALTQDITNGHIPIGSRLPAHRDLADRLGIGLGTVTKAYARLEHQGLVQSVRGRGMFVAGSDLLPREIVDLSINTPPQMLGDRLLASTLAALAKQMDADSFGRYRPPAGSMQHRKAMADWLHDQHLEIAPERLLLTHGAQHAVSIALAVAAGIGGLVFTEATTYPGAIVAARQLRQTLVSVPLDAKGMRPDALDAELAAQPAAHRAVYLTPTLHNPTGATMSLPRRRDIVAVCRAHDVAIIEDDVYSLFRPRGLLPLAQLAPERTFYITGFSKTLSPGLRIGALAVPPSEAERAVSYLQATSSMASPLMCAMMERWIMDGTARSVGEAIRHEAEERMVEARTILAGKVGASPSTGFHLWLPLLLPHAERLAQRAAEAGVMVTPPAAVLVSDDESAAGIRLCLGGPSRDSLARAMRTLRRLLDGDAADVLHRHVGV